MGVSEERGAAAGDVEHRLSAIDKHFSSDPE